jgi:alpha-1,3/alpha-1,6-mannosyltransferase
MSFADSIAVNSGFTKGVASRVWPELARNKDLQIVYPCVNVREKTPEGDNVPAWNDKNILLSINRFEKKKDIGLAIKAYAGLGKHGRAGVRLVLAGLQPLHLNIMYFTNSNQGGYDNRVQENVACHQELVDLAESLKLKTATTKTIVTALNVPDDVEVLFLLSVPSTLKEMLLSSARLLVYTPSNEHFGIVPLEAMLAGVPVLAANTGGPLETVVDGETGWLCPPGDTEKWTAVMDKVLHKMSDKDVKNMGAAGLKRVKAEFSDVKMAERFDELIDGIAGARRKSLGEIYRFSGFTIVVVVILGVVVSRFW